MIFESSPIVRLVGSEEINGHAIAVGKWMEKMGLVPVYIPRHDWALFDASGVGMQVVTMGSFWGPSAIHSIVKRQGRFIMEVTGGGLLQQRVEIYPTDTLLRSTLVIRGDVPKAMRAF